MTIITFKKDSVKVSGHSGYGTAGNDIVCSAISSIVTTTIRAILKHNSKTIDVSSDNALIDIKLLENNDITLLLLDNMKELLKELEDQYKKYVKVEDLI